MIFFYPSGGDDLPPLEFKDAELYLEKGEATDLIYLVHSYTAEFCIDEVDEVDMKNYFEWCLVMDRVLNPEHPEWN